MDWLVSRSRTTFLLLHSDGKKKGLVNALYNFCSQTLHFWGFYVWLLNGVKGQKRLVDRWEWCNHCQPGQRLHDLFLSFNTNQKPNIKSPKSGDFESKNYTGCSPDPSSSRPNIKEEKAVWLCKTMEAKIILTSNNYPIILTTFNTYQYKSEYYSCESNHNTVQHNIIMVS